MCCSFNKFASSMLRVWHMRCSSLCRRPAARLPPKRSLPLQTPHNIPSLPRPSPQGCQQITAAVLQVRPACCGADWNRMPTAATRAHCHASFDCHPWQISPRTHSCSTSNFPSQSLLELVANEMAAEGCRDNEPLQVMRCTAAHSLHSVGVHRQQSDEPRMKAALPWGASPLRLPRRAEAHLLARAQVYLQMRAAACPAPTNLAWSCHPPS